MMRTVKSVCAYCGVGCGVLIDAEDDRIVAVRGDPQHPANFGRLCAPAGFRVMPELPLGWRHRGDNRRRGRTMSADDAARAAAWLREIARGPRAARSLARAEARALFAAVLAGALPEVQIGAILVALRFKGESADELAGFLDATDATVAKLALPAGLGPAIVIPSYNGARKSANLLPLVALLLAREGIPTLMHGVGDSPGRVTTCEIWRALGRIPTVNAAHAAAALVRDHIAFLPIDALSSRLARVLRYREVLGVRNSAHTLAKLIRPITGPALTIVSVTHPAYVERMRQIFTADRRAALLMRGTEGEAVAHPRRLAAIEYWRDGHRSPMLPAGNPPVEDSTYLPASREATDTVAWITDVLAGRRPVPAVIAQQIALCRQAVSALRTECGT